MNGLPIMRKKQEIRKRTFKTSSQLPDDDAGAPDGVNRSSPIEPT
jgi:hypothetical protein